MPVVGAREGEGLELFGHDFFLRVARRRRGRGDALLGECGSPGLDAIAALARGALRTLLGVSTVHAGSEECNDPPQEVGLLAKSN